MSFPISLPVAMNIPENASFQPNRIVLQAMLLFENHCLLQWTFNEV